ncbi:hypothetical protein ROP_54340 [Rhodococcus opacus B4]|uniref:Uncharacterized protein n=1 Tax=Rhodococcus opacus (strain B4) TaxID=632772 RepID=C1AWA8_RHOOB|nr:hypothetical protein ROP_54340 [Rhodococcus opacus B4]
MVGQHLDPLLCRHTHQPALSALPFRVQSFPCPRADLASFVCRYRQRNIRDEAL